MRRMEPFGLPYEGLVFLVSWSRVNYPVGRMERRAEPRSLGYVSRSGALYASRRHAAGLTPTAAENTRVKWL